MHFNIRDLFHILFDRLLMNNVNSISQMNSMVCEHSSLMGHEAKKGPMMAAVPGGEKGPDGKTVIKCSFLYCSRPLFLMVFMHILAMEVKEWIVPLESNQTLSLYSNFFTEMQ